MANLGGLSNFPLSFGGDPSEEEKTYQALQRLVGEGASPPGDVFGDATLIGAWRMARAVGLVAFTSTAEAALAQAFPDLVTDEIQTYEEIVNVFPAIDDPIEKRRQSVTEIWAGEIKSDYPAVQLQLSGIDTRISVLAPVRDAELDVQFGQNFGSASDFNNGHTHTNYPNYSDAFVFSVLFDIGAGIEPTTSVQFIRERAERKLNEILPAWNDYNFAYSIGFILDTSRLDATGLSP